MKKNSLEYCPVCSGVDTNGVFHYDHLPTNIHILLKTEEEARDIPYGAVDFVECRDCGFVWNRIFDESKVSYNKNYETTWSYSPAFNSIVNTVTDFMEPMGDEISIVEIGCGQGDFLKAMAEKLKDRFKLGLGFDPAIRKPLSNDKIQLTADFFNIENFKNLSEKVTTVMARHLIEHMSSPMDLIRNMTCIPFVEKMVIETPNLRYFIENKLYYEFIYEHCSLFMPETLVSIAQRAGFMKCRTRTLLGGLNLLLVAEREDPEESGMQGPGYRIPSSFQDGFNEFVLNMKSLVREAHKKYGKIAIAGGSGKGNIFLAFLGEDAYLISALVEINPVKQSCFLPGTAIPIISPLQSKEVGIRCLILLSDFYVEDVRRQHAEIGMPVHIITPDAFKQGEYGKKEPL